jgi:hypothetical protein
VRLGPFVVTGPTEDDAAAELAEGLVGRDSDSEWTALTTPLVEVIVLLPSPPCTLISEASLSHSILAERERADPSGWVSEDGLLG